MTFWQKEDLPASPPASSESGKISARLLIIEDDRTFATSMQRLLTHAGYRTEAVENGLDGLETLAATRPDLLLVDITTCRT